MQTYNSLSILYLIKTIINTFIIIMPIFYMIHAMSNFIKKRNYKSLLKRSAISFLILILAFYFDEYKLLSNIDIINSWHNVNTSRILAYQDEKLTYVPTIIEPMYIKNNYNIDIDTLKQEIKDIIGSRDISVSFYNFNSLQEFSINGDDMYFAASVSKIHTVMNLYDYAYENNIDLKNINIKYISSDFQGGSGILQNVSNLANKSYNLEYLAEIAIRYSDNIARNMIIRYMSNKRSTISYYKNIVESNYVLKDNNYIMSSNWAIKIIKKIYYNESENPYYDKLILDMKNTASSSNIAEYLDKDKVAHKIGQMYLNGYLYSNDAAIIYSDSQYALTVFTKSHMSEDKMSELIGSISQTIYNKIVSS